MNKLIASVFFVVNASLHLQAQSSLDLENQTKSYVVVSSAFMGFGQPVVNGSLSNIWDFTANHQPTRTDTFGLVANPSFSPPVSGRICMRQYADQYYFTDNTNYWRSLYARVFELPNGQRDMYTVSPTSGVAPVKEIIYAINNGDSSTVDYVMTNTVTGNVLYASVKFHREGRGRIITPYFTFSNIIKYVITTVVSATPGGPPIRVQKEAVFMRGGYDWAVMRSREDRDAQGNVLYSTTDIYKKFTVSGTTFTRMPWIDNGLLAGEYLNFSWPSANVVYGCHTRSQLTVSGLVKSVGGLTNWAAVSSPDLNYDVNHIYAYSPDTVYASQINRIYKSVNGGQSWSRLSINQNASVIKYVRFIHSFSADTLVAVGDALDIQVSNDGGATWSRANSSTLILSNNEEIIPNCIAAMGNTVMIGTNMGRVFYSSNKGVNWLALRVNQRVPIQYTPIKNIALKSATEGIVVNTSDEMWSTSNGGQSWNLLPVIANDNVSVTVGANRGLQYLKGTSGRPGFYILVNQGTDMGTYISFTNGQSWIRFADYIAHQGLSGFDIANILNIYPYAMGTRHTYLNNCTPEKPAIWKNSCELGAMMTSQNFYLPIPKWYKDGIEIPNSQGLSYPITQSGSYQAAYIDPFQGCDQLSDPIVVSVTGSGCDFVISGLEDPIAETTQVGIELFPNPTYGPATLRFHESWAGLQKSVMVYDLAGRLVASLQTSDDQTELNLDAAAGFYMVTVQTENGQRANASLILDAR